MRARVFFNEEGGHRLALELDAADLEAVWRNLQGAPEAAGRPLLPGDIVYMEDVYYELNGDGGWRPLIPGELTRSLYRLIQGNSK